jgi:hypothetical protein
MNRSDWRRRGRRRGLGRDVRKVNRYRPGLFASVGMEEGDGRRTGHDVEESTELCGRDEGDSELSMYSIIPTISHQSIALPPCARDKYVHARIEEPKGDSPQ